MNGGSRLDYEKKFHDDNIERVEARKMPSYFVNDITYLPHEESLRRLGDLKGKRLLNYGVGEGGSTDWILEMGAQEVVGIDISEGMIKRARNNIPSERAKFLVMDAEALEFPGDSFDLVYGIAILHHLNIEQAYKETYKTLRPGGKAVFLEPLGHNIFVNIFRKLTPNARTPFEHPLLVSDLRLAARCFDKVKTTEYFFLSLFVLGIKPILELFGKSIFLKFFMVVYKLDRWILKAVPFLKRYYWITVLELMKNGDHPDSSINEK